MKTITGWGAFAIIALWMGFWIAVAIAVAVVAFHFVSKFW